MKARLNSAVERIVRKHGSITPTQLLAMATPKKSPIHDCFEWVDAKAAHQFRLILARTYIRRVTVTSPDGKPERLVHVPVVVRTKSREGTYKPISVVVKSPVEFEMALNEAMITLRSAEKAVHVLRDAASGEPDSVAMISVVIESLSTARAALDRVH